MLLMLIVAYMLMRSKKQEVKSQGYIIKTEDISPKPDKLIDIR